MLLIDKLKKAKENLKEDKITIKGESISDLEKAMNITDWVNYTKAIPVEASNKTQEPIYNQSITTKTPEYSDTTSTENIKNLCDTEEFLEKYKDGNEAIQVLRHDLMKVCSDINWIIESGNQNEQFAIDFADALNAMSIKF
jgi:vesicle coat complex subunit